MNNIFEYFSTFLRLDAESKSLIASYLESQTLKKGEFLWKAGSICNKLFFIKSGIVRLFFYDEKGGEITVHFESANKFIVDPESLNAKVPSSVSCICPVECEVFILTKSSLEKLDKEVFEWHELSKKITEKSLFDKIKTRNAIFNRESKERYLAFLKYFPTVASAVQASYIASYLGMSQFTLSHLKKELAQNHFLLNSKN